MNVTTTDFRRHFELLSDDALLRTKRDDLIPLARQCLDEEVARRGLDRPDEDSADEFSEPPPAPHPDDELVSVDVPMQPEELSLARGLLESAGIPCVVTNDHVGLGNFQMELKVPASMLEHAAEVLGLGISDEELAAQAEAAGGFEEDFAEEGLEEPIGGEEIPESDYEESEEFAAEDAREDESEAE